MAAGFGAKLFSGLMHMSPYLRHFMEGFEGRGFAGAKAEGAEAALEEDERRRRAAGNVGTVGGTRGPMGPLADRPPSPMGAAQGPMARSVDPATQATPGPQRAGGPLMDQQATPGGVALGPLAQEGPPRAGSPLAQNPMQSSRRLPTPQEILGSAGIDVGFVEPNISRSALKQAADIAQAGHRYSLYRPNVVAQDPTMAEAQGTLRARQRARQAFAQRNDALNAEFVKRTYDHLEANRELANNLKKERIRAEGRENVQKLKNATEERIAAFEAGTKYIENKVKALNTLKKSKQDLGQKQAKFRTEHAKTFADSITKTEFFADNLARVLDAAPNVTINPAGAFVGRAMQTMGLPDEDRATYDVAAKALANMNLDQVEDSQPALYQVMRQIESGINENIADRGTLYRLLDDNLDVGVRELANNIAIQEQAYREFGLEPGPEIARAKQELQKFMDMHTYVKWVRSNDNDAPLTFTEFEKRLKRKREQSQQQGAYRGRGATGQF